MSTLADLFAAYSSPYRKRLTGSVADAREFIALIDFQVKFLLAILAPYSQRSTHKIQLGATPGFGEMLTGIKRAKNWSGLLDPDLAALQSLAVSVLSRVSQNIHNGENLKSIRDRLSHGHPLPDDDSVANAVYRAVHALAGALELDITTNLEDFEYGVDLDGRVFAKFDQSRQILSPVFYFDSSTSAIGLYSSFQADGVYYLFPLQGIGHNTSPANTEMFQGTFLKKDVEQVIYGKFVYELTQDIGSFSEDFSVPHYSFGEDEDVGSIFVTWTRPTSEESEQRIDRFRIGRDNQHQWWDNKSGLWVPYSSFLRSITNWKFLARRIRMDLEQKQAHNNAAILISGGAITAKGPVRLLEQGGEAGKQLDLIPRVDAASEPLKSFTTVFFIVGEAGAGKTELLLTSSLMRAKELEEDPNAEKPLMIYVSSSGQALSNLETVVDSNLASTRLISSPGAKTLCRHGLLALVVDGFDELVGSAGYDNPLGSLASWFKDLRGRGVIVASARSSYYMTRYRTALSRRTDLNVEHIVSSMQSWSREEAQEYLENVDVAKEYWETLSENDWALLSIPFFAKTFAQWARNHEQTDGALPSIFEIVINQYLTRESKKLLDSTGSPLLKVSELQNLFSEFADAMHMEGKRELEQSELEFCAQVAFNLDDLDHQRQNLRRRLTSLCGISIESGGQNSKFQFSHDVIFNCFLSLSLANRAQRLENVGINKFFSSSDIDPVVIEWFVSTDRQTAESLLNSLTSDGNYTSATWRKNVGSLWTCVLNARNGIPPEAPASRLTLGELKLASQGWQSVSLRDCTIDHLELSASSKRVDIQDSRVNFIFALQDEAFTSLKNPSVSNIRQIASPISFFDTVSQIRKHFERLGIIPPSPAGSNTDWDDTASYFINSMLDRPDTPLVVYADGFEVDDGVLGWTKKLGKPTWAAFITSLLRNNLAHRENLNSAGRPKLRISFDVSISEISERSVENERVRNFWAGR